MDKNKKFYIGLEKFYKKKYIQDYATAFADITGDKNPIHLDKEYAKRTILRTRVGHGMWCAGLISAAISQELPGPGSIYKSQSLNFFHPVRENDSLVVKLLILEIRLKKKLFVLETVIENQNNRKILDGEAVVILPSLTSTDLA